jgi:hypothetical protein
MFARSQHQAIDKGTASLSRRSHHLPAILCRARCVIDVLHFWFRPSKPQVKDKFDASDRLVLGLAPA